MERTQSLAMYIKRTINLLTVSIFFLLLVGCSAKPRSEKEIVEDLQDSSQFIPVEGLEISDYEIIKRQTDQKEKQDVVYIAVDACNEEFECNVEYKMTYGLYNEGWFLDEVEIYEPENWEITPLRGVDDSVVLGYVDEAYMEQEGYESIEIYSHDSSLEENSGVDIVTLRAIKDHYYGTEEIYLSQTWVFDEYGLYTYVAGTEPQEDHRYLIFKDTFEGATWTDLPRHYRASNVYGDTFDVYITSLGEDGDISCAVTKYTISFFNYSDGYVYEGGWNIGGISPILAYNREMDKWGLNLEFLSGYFYNDGDSDDFDEDSYLFFDLDEPNEAGIAQWRGNIEKISYDTILDLKYIDTAFENFENNLKGE